MNVSELLKPLVEKSMKVKAYSRELAVEKSMKWLARELGVSPTCLHDLSYEQQWCAHAIVEKALLPHPKKIKKKFAPPVIKQEPLTAPWNPEQWGELQVLWGDSFYESFFGEWTKFKVTGTLSPGQYAIDEIKKANKTALVDAA